MNKSNKQAVFVVFEGLDGTGKTSSAKQTAQLLGAHYMTTPSLALRTHRDEIIGSFKGNQEAAQMFYLATVLAASDEAKSCLATGQSVVLDRYFLSTQVYAEFRGSVLDVDESVGKLLLPADWTVFLEASLNVRQSRARERGCSAADSETLTPAANLALLHGYERRMQLPVTGQRLRVDTSVMSIQEISQRIITKISNREVAFA
jgi:dTMP kinase